MKKNYTTFARRKILEILKNSRESTVTAAEIGARLKEREDEVNMATIYRFLDKLEREGNIIRCAPEQSGGQASFLYVENGGRCDEHLHLVCVRCRRVMHLECGFMDEISRHLQDEHGFILSPQSSTLYGVCEECKNLGKEKSKDMS